MSLIGYNLLNQIVREPSNYDLNAAQILDRLNNEVIETLKQRKKDGLTRDGMDINLCIIDTKTKILNYAGAVNYLYVIRNGELIKLIADTFSIGIPITGVVEKFTNHEFNIQKDDLFIQYTDGYADQLGGETGYKKFLYPKFREMFLTIYNLPMEKQKEVVEQTILKWKGHHEQTDDILVIGFKVY